MTQITHAEFVEFMIQSGYAHYETEEEGIKVFCPECEEFIDEADYPYIEMTEAGECICPICEEAL